MAIKNVLLVGATGNVGPAIYSALKSSPSNFNITILTRPSSKSKQPEDATVIRYDYSDPSLVEVLKGQDAVVTSIGGLGHGILSQIDLIDASVKAGVKKYIASEYGSDTLNSRTTELLPMYADKRKVHDHLVKVGQEHPEFSYAALITGGFFTFGVQTGFLGYDLKNHTATIVDGGDLQVSYTDIPQVALAVARVLERDVSGYLKISSVTCSQNDIVEVLQRLQKVEYEKKAASTEEYEKQSKEMMSSQDEGTKINGYVLGILRIHYGQDCGGNWRRGDNEKLGLEEQRLDDLVRQALGMEML